MVVYIRLQRSGHSPRFVMGSLIHFFFGPFHDTRGAHVSWVAEL